MAQPFTSPKRSLNAFHCPLCGAFSQVIWQNVFRGERNDYGTILLDEFRMSNCTHCRGWLLWHGHNILVPDVSSAPPANEDLPKDILEDYAEAASVAAKSSRGAAALLRLCIQKLCRALGEKGKNIDEDIGSLVKKGLDVRVQQALDTVRVVGNEAVHPGEMDIKDDNETVGQLFVLVNAIANDLITQPRLRDELYNKLPANKLAGIAARDGKPPTQK